MPCDSYRPNMTTPQSPARGIDPRGPRFGALITTVVLAVALLTLSSPVGGILLAIQTVAFALGAIVGLKAQPYGWIYARLVRPRLAPPKELEDPAPPRFAQAVGLVFAAVALVAFLLGATVVAAVATGLALIAAFLNAAFAFCLGCEIYLLIRRVGSSAA